MSHDPNEDDHLIFGADADEQPPSRHARPAEEEGESWGGEPFGETTQVRPTPPPPYAEPADHDTRPPQYDRQPPQFSESPQIAEPPPYAEPQYAEPQYAEPQYAEQPPQYREQPPQYGEQPPQYGEQPPQYGEQPPPQYGEQPPPQYGEQPPPQYHEQPPPQAAHPAQQHPQQAPQQQAPATPPAMPRPEDLLAPNRYATDVTPASWGWRGKVNRGTGGMIKPKASSEEAEARKDITAIQRSFSRPMTVVVVQPKGGAGKTPTTICLSAAFGAHRGGYVVGWDDNETRGTLAVRVANPDNQRATVWDLLSDLPAFERLDARVGDLSYYVRAQPDAHFDALVSDDNPANMAQIGEDEYHRLHQVLQRFYRLIVVDTGNNVRSPNWQSAVNSADLVVVVSTYQRDVGWSASWVLDHLAQTGREELARNAVTILSAADPTPDKDVRAQLLSHFSARTRAVTEIPYDDELAHGGPISWTGLQDATRNAWVHAGAIVVNALVEQDNRTLAARRA